MGEAKRANALFETKLNDLSYDQIRSINQYGKISSSRKSPLTYTQMWRYFKEATGGGTRATAPIACNGCKACCYHKDIELLPEELDKYQSEPTKLESNKTGFSLKHKEDGSCVYLGETGCTIYDDRPKVCKSYDCRFTSFFKISFYHTDDPTSQEPYWAFRNETFDDHLLDQVIDYLSIEYTKTADDPDHAELRLAFIRQRLSDTYKKFKADPSACEITKQLIKIKES